ncbi:MAG: imidazole glycerol phosphate synthase subunit HisF, partial [Flavobacteriales bacterium]|nr:imidazole glycerol phosphate synthase subunit HisF [Flavobacteriales bacterium]
MFRPRVIPVLLLNGSTLVKSIKFKDYNYIGDPINAVKIFNDLKADELVFLDINASNENRTIPLSFVSQLSEETNMPFAVGGGIKTLEDIQKIISAGAEKVIINSAAIENPNFIKEATEHFGTSTIVVCIDVKRKLFKGEKVFSRAGKKSSNYSPVEFAKLMEQNGAGELIVQSIERDGTMEGYDFDLIESISKSVTIPVVALGGAGNRQHFKRAYQEGYASALGAGSMFVYQGKKRG